MADFLSIALRNAARGFRVMPIKGKDAFLRNWPVLATTDEAQIREWARQFPNHNCGIAAGPDIAIVDSDRVSRLKELAGEHASEWFNTYSVSSGREDRAHFYYCITDEVRAFGNKRWGEPGIVGNVFEAKVQGGQVAAEGSTHPDTGGLYKITQDLPLLTFPPGLVTLLRECYAKTNPTGKREWNLPVHDGEGRDDFLIQQAGRLRHVGCDEDIILAHLERLNSDPAIMADPKPHEDLLRIARSAARYDVPAPAPIAVIGKSRDLVIAKRSSRPVYPDDAWDSTVVAEFAKVCTSDNHIPRKLFTESFRTGLGAVVGDRICAPSDGLITRNFSILICPKGKGKGTAVRRTEQFFSGVKRLLNGERNFPWKSKGIGARTAAASSVPGLARLVSDSKKLMDTSPHLCWAGTTPRILFLHEELKTLLSTLFIEGGVGINFEGVLCQLWDDVTFSSAATATREALYGEVQLSLLGAITPEDWTEIVGRGDVIGGGFMSRLNIIGTEGTHLSVSRLRTPDFTPLQAALFPRIEALANTPAILPVSEGADRLIAEWIKTLPEDSERLNVQVWRTALLLSWLLGHSEISEDCALRAIRLGDYQVKMREHYRVDAARNLQAALQGKIRKVLKQRGPMQKKAIYKVVHAEREGTNAWRAAWEGLTSVGELVSLDGGHTWGILAD
jgi:hypothetical protein